jgi:hypothetical protein
LSAPEPKPVVSKVNAAGSQIDTAIWLWFNDADVVSIHTLTDAAFGVILDLYHKKKWKPPIPFDETDNPRGVTPKAWRKKVREAGAFGKHARWDHDLDYEFNPLFIESFLACAVSAHGKLQGTHKGSLRTLFALWFSSRYPQLAEANPMATEGIAVDQVGKMSKAEFFQQFGADFIGHPPRPSYT